MTAAFTASSALYKQRTKPLHRSADRGESSLIQPVPARTVSFKRHENFSFVHHSLWQIHSGYVRTLTWNAEGEFVPLGFWTAGDIIGYPIAQTYPYEAECLTTVEAEHLSMGYALSREAMLGQIRQSNSLLRIAHCRNSEQRILQFICWLAARFGKAIAKGIEIPLRLTHQEIAESVGTTRVTVTRLLKSLERKQHIIWKTQEKIVFRNTFEQSYVQAARGYRA